jgi:hypothetical protein
VPRKRTRSRGMSGSAQPNNGRRRGRP